MKRLVLGILATATVAITALAQSGNPLPGPGNVALPLDEYNRLVEMAANPAKPRATPPMPFALQSAQVKLEVAGDRATGTIQLEGEVFGTGNIRVPLVNGFTVFDGRRQGSVLPLLVDGPMHSATLAGPDLFSLALDVGVPLTIETGRASLRLIAPPAGTVRLALAIPGDHTNVHLSPGIITSKASSGGRTTIEATLTGGHLINIWWAARETAAAAQTVAPRESRFLATLMSLITVGEAGTSLATLAEISVLQGEPARFDVTLPEGYELTGASGPTLESSEVQSGRVVLAVKTGARSHQVLLSLEKSTSTPKEEIVLPSLIGSQRETGEVLVEGEGTMELNSTESGGLKRMDVKEANATLRSMARHSIHSAFRYHRQTGEAPRVSLEWVRFPDTTLLAAVAERATVTTLISGEGRSLTEVKLSIRNREQPFLKVALPSGATLVSADVAGEAVKPVMGADGGRVPLLHPGFRPSGDYAVSFVYVHSGTPFVKKGASELALPQMDLPIGLLEWEVFMPKKLRVRNFTGDAIPESLVPSLSPGADGIALADGLEGQPLAGVVSDRSGATIPGAQVTVTHIGTGATATTVAGPNGAWSLAGFPAGRAQIRVYSRGFNVSTSNIVHSATRAETYRIILDVGAVSETIEVSAMASPLKDKLTEQMGQQAQNQASSNVLDLQRRVAGVLPVRMDVPRAGTSHRFVKPLVVDQETMVSLRYKRR